MAKSNWFFSLRQLAIFVGLVLKLKFVYATDRISFSMGNAFAVVLALGNVCPLLVVIG